MALARISQRIRWTQAWPFTVSHRTMPVISSSFETLAIRSWIFRPWTVMVTISSASVIPNPLRSMRMASMSSVVRFWVLVVSAI